MSGFLQRLAAAAISPARSIHPVVGSVYSSSDKPMGAGGGLESASTVMAPDPAAAPTGAAAAAVSMTPSVNPPRLEPLAPTSPAERQGEPSLTAFANPAPRNNAEPIPRFAEHRAAETPVMESRETAATRPPPLLMPRNPAEAADARSVEPERRAVMPVTSRPPVRAAARVDPPREPDEIQIHIGRIEVTAMPPSAAPRAVKTPRRGLSLDAYLKRGERSTR